MHPVGPDESNTQQRNSCSAVYPRAGAGHLKDIDLEPRDSKGNPSGSWGKGCRGPEAITELPRPNRTADTSLHLAGMWFSIQTTECFKSGLFGSELYRGWAIQLALKRHEMKKGRESKWGRWEFVLPSPPRPTPSPVFCCGLFFFFFSFFFLFFPINQSRPGLPAIPMDEGFSNILLTLMANQPFWLLTL